MTANDPTCGARYGGATGPALLGSAGWREPTCTLPAGHDGSHADDVLDAPATVAWTDPKYIADLDTVHDVLAHREQDARHDNGLAVPLARTAPDGRCNVTDCDGAR